MEYYLIVFQFGVRRGPTGSKALRFPFHPPPLGAAPLRPQDTEAYLLVIAHFHLS